MTSRRSFLTACGAGFATAAAAEQVCPGSSSGGPVYRPPKAEAAVRLPLHGWNDEQWEAFASAHDKVRRKYGVALAEWHRSCCATQNGGVHEGTWFLAWHRLIVHLYERALREEAPTLSVPYWDWEDYVGIPDRYDSDGRLRPFDANGALDTVARDGAYSPWVPSALDTSALFVRSGYIAFSAKVAASEPHWLIHAWTSSQMRVPARAAFDPLFYAHHANIDRLWYRWKLAFPDCLMDEQTAKLEIQFRDLDNTVRTVPLGALWDEAKLGYTYPKPKKTTDRTQRFLEIHGLPVVRGVHGHHHLATLTLELDTPSGLIAFPMAVGPAHQAEKIYPARLVAVPENLDLARGYQVRFGEPDALKRIPTGRLQIKDFKVPSRR
jgi:hypothetical protein